MKKVFAVVLALAMVFCMVACGESEPETNTASLQIGQYIGACHGTKCFSVITAVVEGDKIVDCYIDEFQYMDHTAEGVVAVPNSDNAEGFGANYTTDNWLGSKRESDVYYTNALATKASATMDYVDNLTTIEDFCTGKTLSELSGVDAVSGCTLTDAANYVNGVVEAAKLAQANEAVTYEYTGDSYNLTLNCTTAAAHGTKCFTWAAALTDGTTVVLSWVDEYQFMTAGADGVVAVPNSDALASYITEGVVLGSKRQSDVYYTNALKTKASATMDYVDNLNTIQSYCNGKTIEELSAGVDAISGCTLTDAANYVQAIVKAAK